MKSLHYCFFCANYLPNLGGVERYTYNLAKKLVAAGNQVTVVTSNVFALEEQETVDGIEIIRLPCFKLLGGRFPVLKPNRDFRRLNAMLKKRKFDFAVIQTRFYVHSGYAALYCKRMGIPGIVIEHGTNHFTVNNPVLDFVGSIYEHFITFVIRRCRSDFYGVSQACCDWLKHFKIQAKGRLYNAVDPDEIERNLAACTKSYREELGLQDSVIVTYTGRLVREKGIQKLVDAVTELNKSNSRIKLLVAGDGDLFEQIKQQSHPNVILLGRLNFDEIIALLKETDVFCLPTDYPEGFPTSVLEAAAAKCYIVTTTKGGSKELILDETYGAILTDNSVKEIADAILRAVTDQPYRISAAEKSCQRLRDNFTWDCISREVIALAEEAVQSSTPV